MTKFTTAFNVGDIVTIRESAADSFGFAKEYCGKPLKVLDVIHSSISDQDLYIVSSSEPGQKALPFSVCDDWLDWYEEDATYETEIEDAGNVIIVRIYAKNGERRSLLTRAHGHVLHDGAYGYVQALSYALRRAQLSMMPPREEQA